MVVKPRVVCYLVGAGPGDIGLATLRARDLVSKASSIVYDRLIPHALLGYAPDSARKIYVGKAAKQKSITQRELNSVLLRECRLVEKNLLVKNQKAINPSLGIVVRLKGGDPMLFGRVVEEMEALRRAKIAFEVVPGVSSGFAVPAFAGIPLTARGISRSVSFITGSVADKTQHTKAISGADTVVYLMAVSNLPAIVKQNLTCGKSEKTPVALIENGTLPSQRVVLGMLGNIVEKARVEKIAHPGLLVVGKVVDFAHKYPWFLKKPFLRLKVGLFRAEDEILDWVLFLQKNGADVLCLPLVSSVPVGKDSQSLINCLNSDWANTVVFTSKRAVAFFFSLLKKKKLDLRILAGKYVVAVGSGTALSLTSFGIIADAVASGDGQKGVLSLLRKRKQRIDKQMRLVYPRAAEVNPFLEQKLIEEGVEVKTFVVYKNKAEKISEEQCNKLFDLNAFVLSSGIAVQSFFSNFGKLLKNRLAAESPTPLPKLIFFDKVSEKRFEELCEKQSFFRSFSVQRIKRAALKDLEESLFELKK